MAEITRDMIEKITKKLVDEGKVIAAGFAGMRLSIIPKDATQSQIEDMELAYIGGAQHLWATMMSIIGPDADPTEADMRRMAQIDVELRMAEERLKARAFGRGH